MDYTPSFCNIIKRLTNATPNSVLASCVLPQTETETEVHPLEYLVTHSQFLLLPAQGTLHLLVSLPSFTPTTFTSEDGEQHCCVNLNDEKQNTTLSFVIGKAFNLHFSKHT